MPEVPDLEAIRKYFNRTVAGETIEKVDTPIPVVIRVPREEFVRLMSGDTLGEVHRHGKFLLFTLASGRIMVINAMLTGRFSVAKPSEKRHARTCFALSLSGGHELRYADQRLMGRVYLATPDTLETLPQFAEMGPDVLSPSLTEDVFRDRLRKYSGQIKSVLVNHKFVAGIGNAYADEILWEARVHPYRKRTQMDDAEVGALYHAMRDVLDWAEPIVWEKMGEGLDYKEWRDHLRVHRRGGEPCPRCGTTISEITAGQRITSFCRTCQPEVPRGF
ncbi:MAG TPA: DNA-formamidopyrimidine glycosylase family protein [Dehalococcoidia bacterium]|nr:DNA-formamidopyrimidine glycosylase family protein [Dehalococcoidia bacterium]